MELYGDRVFVFIGDDLLGSEILTLDTSTIEIDTDVGALLPEHLFEAYDVNFASKAILEIIRKLLHEDVLCYLFRFYFNNILKYYI